MDKERFKEIVDDPRFIPGIHNFCDRWCERCLYTERCSVYAVEQERDTETAPDGDTREFWDKLGEVFQVTTELLGEIALQKGIDLDDLGAEDVDDGLSNLDAGRKHSSCQQALEYSRMSDAWFDKAEPLFKTKQAELNMAVSMELPGSDPKNEAASINDAVEVIRWYQHQLYVKLMRAVTGRLRADESDEEYTFAMDDADGSAKVVLIGLDRTIGAWGLLYKEFPGLEDTTLDILLQLDRLRKRVEQMFPKARDFIRPGFDTDDEPFVEEKL